MSAQFLLGSNVGDLYAYALGAPVRGRRLYDPDFALRQDPEVYAKLYRDSTIAQALRYRKYLVAGRDWFMEPASPSESDRRCATLLESLLKKIPRFTSARFNLSEALLRGSSWARIHWRRETVKLHGDDRPRTWAVAFGLQDVPKFRFRLMNAALSDARTPEEKQRASRLPTDAIEWRWEINRPTTPGMWHPIDLGAYVHHVYDDAEETLGHGRGLAEALVHIWVYKTAVLVYGEQFLDRWANGLVHVGINSLRSQSVGTSVGPDARNLTPQARAQAWADAINAMRHQHVIAHDKDDELGVLDAPSGAWGASKEALDYCNNEIRSLIIGSNLTTNASEGGSYALAKIQENATEAYVGYDRLLLEETITEQLVKRVHAINAPVWKELGLEDAEPPTFRLREDARYDPKQRVEVAKSLIDMGVQLRRDEVISQSGYSPPMPGEDVIGSGQPAAPAGGPFGTPDVIGSFGKPPGQGGNGGGDGMPREETAGKSVLYGASGGENEMTPSEFRREMRAALSEQKGGGVEFHVDKMEVKLPDGLPAQFRADAMFQGAQPTPQVNVTVSPTPVEVKNTFAPSFSPTIRTPAPPTPRITAPVNTSSGERGAIVRNP